MLQVTQENSRLYFGGQNKQLNHELVSRREQYLNIFKKSFSLRTVSIPSDKKLINPDKIQNRSEIIESGILISDRYITPYGTFNPSIGNQSVEILGDVDSKKKTFSTQGQNNPSSLWPNFLAKRLSISLNENGDATLSVDEAEPFENAVIVRISAVADGAEVNGRHLPNPKNNYLATSDVYVIKEQLGSGYLGNRYFDITWMNLIAIMAVGSEIAYHSLDGISLINPEVNHQGQIDTSIICLTILRFNSSGKLELIKGPYKNDDIFRSSPKRLNYLKSQLSNKTK
jgi:hypothetical protein